MNLTDVKRWCVEAEKLIPGLKAQAEQFERTVFVSTEFLGMRSQKPLEKFGDFETTGFAILVSDAVSDGVYERLSRLISTEEQQK